MPVYDCCQKLLVSVFHKGFNFTLPKLFELLEVGLPLEGLEQML